MPAEKVNPVVEADIGTVFDLVTVGGMPGCRHCNGLSVVEVQCSAGTVGRLEAEYPWHMEVPDEIEDHPNSPHYEVEWVARDIHGNLIDLSEAHSTPTTLFFNAVEMMRLARKGLIPIEAKKSGKKKG